MTPCRLRVPPSSDSRSGGRKSRFWSTTSQGAYIPKQSHDSSGENVEDADGCICCDILNFEQDDEGLSESDHEPSPEKTAGEMSLPRLRSFHWMVAHLFYPLDERVLGYRTPPTWKYVWNEHLLKPVLSDVHQDWLLSIIHGFIGQSSILPSTSQIVHIVWLSVAFPLCP